MIKIISQNTKKAVPGDYGLPDLVKVNADDLLTEKVNNWLTNNGVEPKSVTVTTGEGVIGYTGDKVDALIATIIY
jgi:hypothetical protein